MQPTRQQHQTMQANENEPRTPPATPDTPAAPATEERRRAERLRRAAQRRRQPPTYERPVWRTLARGFEEGYSPEAPSLGQVERWRPRDRYADRNTEAEYAFYRVSGRFQQYAAEYLFANERILAFAPWTAELTESWLTRVGRALAPGGRHVREGALLVTDRQVLLLRDDEEGVAGTFFWGYTAHATTPERLGAVALRPERGGQLRLRLYLRAGSRQVSGELVEWLFAAESADAAWEAATVLRDFLPRAGDTRLRRRGSIEPLQRLVVAPRPPEPGRRRVALHVEIAPAERTALEAALAAALEAPHLRDPLGRPRRLRASAIAPRADRRRGPRLAAVTQSHLLVVPLPDEGPAASHPLANVTSAELQRSPLGYHVAWTLGGTDPAGIRASRAEGAPRRVALAFPPPAYPQFFAVFAALRQALGLLPRVAAGAELPEPELSEPELAEPELPEPAGAGEGTPETESRLEGVGAAANGGAPVGRVLRGDGFVRPLWAAR